MKNLNRHTVMLIFIALTHVVGCGATTTAPKGWLPPLSVAQHEAFGGWTSVRYHTGVSESEVHGELIAIHSNQVFILTVQELTSLSSDSISYMKLTVVQLAGDRAVDRDRQMIYPAKPLDEFRAYARFPQGLPKDIDRQSLKPKRPGAKISASTKAPGSPQKHRNRTKF
jgi:hypothetical protein